jgi:protein TonB
MWLTEQNPEVKTFDVASVTLTRGCCAFAQAERWLYQMYFDPVVAGRRLFGGTNFMAVVLLDGSIVEPRIDPAPGQSPAPARTTPGAPAAPSTPVRLGGGIPAPQRIKNVDPVYPADAQNDRVQGVVIIEAIVGADGKIQDARVLRSVPLLDAAALDAVRQWEYTPTILNGVPVPVIMTVTVNFALK